MRNSPYGFEIYLVNAKTIRTIAQIFVAFSEKLNFKYRKGFEKQSWNFIFLFLFDSLYSFKYFTEKPIILFQIQV